MELDGQLTHTYPSFPRAVFISSIFLMIWFFPIALLFPFTEYGNVFVQQSLFFSKLAVVTFGGAYAVLAYMAQQAVDVFNWLSAQEMLDGLGWRKLRQGP